MYILRFVLILALFVQFFFFRKHKHCCIDFELSYLSEFYDLGRDKIYTVFKYLVLLFDAISVSCTRFTVFMNKIVEKR